MFIRLLILALLCTTLGYGASVSVAQDKVIKVENAKLPPVSFSHSLHVDKQKVECAVCHHSDPKKPKACTTCHKLEVQGRTPSAKEAFHGKCVTCHKGQAKKGGNSAQAPTRCNDCHKR